MSENKYQKPHIIKIENSIDERGQVNFFELGKDIDFVIKRVYYISNVPNNKDRGQHAHKELRQLILAINGVVEIEIDDGKGDKKKFTLDSIEKALYLPCGYWRVLNFASQDTICFVFASSEYDKDDYIRDYQEFIDYKNTK